MLTCHSPDTTRGAPQPGFDPESAPGIRGTVDFNLTNALHVIKDLLPMERRLRYDIPSGLVAYAAQCRGKTTTQIS